MRLCLLAALMLPFSASAIELQNFKAGLACTDARTFGWICHETYEVLVTGQGRCNFDGKSKPCTWFGFEFDYTSLGEDETVECSANNSFAVRFGNPKQADENRQKNKRFKLPLKPGSGHFFNPQYVLLTAPEEPPYTLQQQISCSVSDKELFKFDMFITYPKMPDSKQQL